MTLRPRVVLAVAFLGVLAAVLVRVATPWRGRSAGGVTAPVQNIPIPLPEGRPAGSSFPPLAFRDVAAEAGLTVPHFPAADGRFRLVETMGGGVALFDFDQDGWLDIACAQGAALPADPTDRTHAAQLYRNNRDGTFAEVARAAGVAFAGYATGLAVGDYDRDGRPDLFCNGFNTLALYHNNGDGTFTDATEAAGLTPHGWGTSCAFADLDNDGDLDLYLVRYLADTVDALGRPTVVCNALPGAIGYCPPLAYAPEPDALYRNNGDGTFTDVSTESGVAASRGNGLGLAIADFDDDGKLDVFVANDKTPGLLFRNLGGLRFEEVGLPWGVAYNEGGEATAGMGVAAGDADGDGRTDLLVTNFYEEGINLYRSASPGQFEVATARSRLKLPTRSKLGFGAGFLDADNDGALDLFLTNGHVNDVRPVRMPYRMEPQLFHNRGDGRFDDASAQAGPYFRALWLGRGAAFGDLNNDGATDVVVTHNDGPPALLRNETPGRGHALRLSLAALVPGRPGVRDHFPVGARVTARVGGRSLTREVVGGTSYLSAHDPRLLIGLGPADRADRVEVRWPSGKVETWEGVAADGLTVLAEGRAPALGEGPPP